MSKLDMLNSYLSERLAVAVREILEAVEATVTQYQQETAQTRIENETLKQQLRDVLRVAETAVREPVHNVSKSDSEEMSPCGEQEWSCILQAEPQAPEQGPGQNEGLLSEGRPDVLDMASVCKEESDSEVVTAKVGSRTESHPSVDTQDHISQRGMVMSLPVVRLHRVKVEPEETEITVSLLDPDLPTDAVLSYSPRSTQSTLNPSGGPPLTDTTDRGVARATAPPPPLLRLEKAPKEVRNEVSYECPHCRKSFQDLRKLHTHQQAHERTFGCNWCSKAFCQSADLRRHMRTHTGERPYCCTWCSKSFSQRSNLRRHVRIHTGERPYKCPRCECSFSDGHTLKKHQRKHEEERHCCSLCEQSFTLARSLQLHLIKQHLVEKANAYA
ncbi:hypothetical protein P4O66_007626 [Electrophorus voltai]|uniref:C2H2-type domain-containing protein n=1 Tax=Electrophorus voltai TaxID=2609070 RepID=A0AAD8ZL09_9TELE|nr:hypothetical protein P4O66_007626 [Electrophorus voltai]